MKEPIVTLKVWDESFSKWYHSLKYPLAQKLMIFQQCFLVLSKNEMAIYFRQKENELCFDAKKTVVVVHLRHVLRWFEKMCFKNRIWNVPLISTYKIQFVGWSSLFSNMHWYTVQWVKHDVGWSLWVKWKVWDKYREESVKVGKSQGKVRRRVWKLG